MDGESNNFVQRLQALSVELADLARMATPALAMNAVAPRDPATFTVIENGSTLGSVSFAELKGRVWTGHGVTFDVLQNQLIIQHLDDAKPIVHDLRCPVILRSASRLGRKRVRRDKDGHGRARQQRPGPAALQVLRILMEHPGVGFTEQHLGQLAVREWSRNLLAKIIERLRELLGDRHSKHPFLLTDSNTEATHSPTGRVYYLDPRYRYRVIRVAPEPRSNPNHNSSLRPSLRPSAHDGTCSRLRPE
jgi:hypothetical protein